MSSIVLFSLKLWIFFIFIIFVGSCGGLTGMLGRWLLLGSRSNGPQPMQQAFKRVGKEKMKKLRPHFLSSQIISPPLSTQVHKWVTLLSDCKAIASGGSRGAVSPKKQIGDFL